jgi:hypothetical protein
MADLKFVCADHSRIMETVDDLIGAEEACNYCGAAPIVIVYRSWADKIVAACKAHREIVEEMIDRDNA